jgi:hypothetical protein
MAQARWSIDAAEKQPAGTVSREDLAALAGVSLKSLRNDLVQSSGSKIRADIGRAVRGVLRGTAGAADRWLQTALRR